MTQKTRIPSFHALMLPTLMALDDGCEVAISDVWTRIADTAGLPPSDMKEISFANRVGRSLTHLRHAGLVERVRRGVYRRTREGSYLLCSRPEGIGLQQLRRYPSYARWAGGGILDSEERGTAVEAIDASDGPEEGLEDPVWREAVSMLWSHFGDCVHFSIDFDPELGMLPAFAEALFEHARCTSCGTPPQACFIRCPCGDDESINGCKGMRGWADYRVDRVTWDASLAFLWKQDRRRAYGRAYERTKSNLRQERTRNSDELPYTPDDIEILRDIQNEACYYCATSIRENAQVEHLRPLARGGSNGFNNIVLACPSCNRKKHALSETQFWRRLRGQMPPAQFQLARKLADTIKDEKRRRRSDVGR